MILGSSRFPSTTCWIQRVQEPGSGPDSRYLTAALKALVDEEVHLSASGTLRPVRFESPTDPDRVVIVQPIRRAL